MFVQFSRVSEFAHPQCSSMSSAVPPPERGKPCLPRKGHNPSDIIKGSNLNRQDALAGWLHSVGTVVLLVTTAQNSTRRRICLARAKTPIFRVDRQVGAERAQPNICHKAQVSNPLAARASRPVQSQVKSSCRPRDGGILLTAKQKWLRHKFLAVSGSEIYRSI